MIKKIKPKFTDMHEPMYKPQFIPHPKEICQNLKKRHTPDIKKSIKSLNPSRNTDIII